MTRNRKQTNRRSQCAVNVAVEMIGDQWSLLIIRECLLHGASRFNEFRNMDERISSNILSERLQSLMDAGIIERTPDPDDRRRVIYSLSEVGQDLAPVVEALGMWALKHFENIDKPGPGVPLSQQAS